MANEFVEYVNTAAEAIPQISEIDEVDIATAPLETVWEDGKVQL